MEEGKAGWVKKAPGRLLASYKDRYILLESTHLLLYDSQELRTCLEKLDLENFDRCQELRSQFTKKQRLILVHCPKASQKVQDVKLQVGSSEEKEAWIQALSEAINRAKNKVLDQVTVDSSSNLEHITRTRPKGNRNRRPPTRIHMKEVANLSSDGILRLDLDLVDAMMPNGSREYINVEVARNPAGIPYNGQKQLQPGDEEGGAPQKKKVLKPPMPPNKVKPMAVPEKAVEVEDRGEEAQKPPVAVSEEPKLSVLEESTGDKPEKSPDVSKKTRPPPVPLSRPATSSSGHPPTPPSKEKKPTSPPAETKHQVQDTLEEEEEEEEGQGGTSAEEHEGPHRGDEEEEVKVHKDADEEPCLQPHVPEPVRKSPCPLRPEQESSGIPEPKMRDMEEDTTEHNDPGPDVESSLDAPLKADQTRPDCDVPEVVISPEDPDSQLLSNQLGEESTGVEEKSLDSGQHSDSDSEVSTAEDTLAASTAALRGSNALLDVLDNSDDDAQGSRRSGAEGVTDRSKAQRLSLNLRQWTKIRSASSDNLLSSSSHGIQRRHTSTLTKDVMKLETEVCLEMEKTNYLLSRASRPQGADDSPEDLLAEAMEKLKKADCVLREVKKLSLLKNTTRNSL